jgi:hypothetical protein
MIDNEMRFITRTSDGRGWQVSANRASKKFTKRFSDAIYGGIGATLLEAKIYRNSVQDEIEKESKSIFAGDKPPFFTRAQVNSKSQVVGVCRSNRSNYWRGADQWVATWRSEPNKKCQKGFSVVKYGNEGAFKLAFEARQQGISERMKIENKMVLVK